VILDYSSLRLEAVLAGAVSANQPEAHVDYVDWSPEGRPSPPATFRVALNSATDVVILAAPTANPRREPVRLSIYNKDTAAVTVTVKTDDGSGTGGSATLASDDANRADGAIGANWATVGASGGFAIKTNQFANGATLNVASYYTAVASPNDQWSQATVKAMSSLNWIGVAVRHSAAAATYYAGGANNGDFSNANRRIWKDVAGARTSLATEAIDVAVNDVLRLEVQGTTLVLFVNGVQRLSVVDAAIATGSFAIVGRATGGTDQIQLDDWSGGDFSAGTGTERIIVKEALAVGQSLLWEKGSHWMVV